MRAKLLSNVIIIALLPLIVSYCSEDTLLRARSGKTLIAVLIPGEAEQPDSGRLTIYMGDGNPLYDDYKPLTDCYASLIIAGNEVYRLDDRKGEAVYSTGDRVPIKPGSTIRIELICNGEEYVVESIVQESKLRDRSVDLPHEHPSGVNMAVNFDGLVTCYVLYAQESSIQDTCPSRARDVIDAYNNPFLSSITLSGESLSRRGKYFLTLYEFTEPENTTYSSNLSLLSRFLLARARSAGFRVR